MLRRLGCIVLAGAAALVLLIGGNFYWGWTGEGPAQQELAIVIPAGSSLARAAQVLEDKGAISSAGAFLNRAKVFGGDDPIKAGEFVIPARASNAQILNILQGGEVVLRMVTVPEGMPSILV